MKRLSVLGIVVVVVLWGLAFPGPAVADAQETNASNPADQQQFAETQFVVTVFENGSARWTQRYNQPLTNQTEMQRFRAYAERFESEETPLYRGFRKRATSLTEAGSNATGRAMDARGFTRQARVTSQPTATGVVEMSFVWTNFTAVEDERVLVGDVFENGLYLSSSMSLTVEAGPDLDVAWDSVEPTPDATTNESGNTTESFTYFGERQFASGHPRVAFTPESSVVANSSPMSGAPIAWIAGALVLALVLGAVVVRRSDIPLGRDTETTGATDTTDTAETPVETAVETNEAMTTPPAVSDEQLKSDEEQVTELLEENGGRMQQSDIVEETGWSKSKVSMLLSEMEEAGDLSKLRVGRENIVSLSGHEPEATRSPFEDG